MYEISDELINELKREIFFDPHYKEKYKKLENLKNSGRMNYAKAISSLFLFIGSAVTLGIGSHYMNNDSTNKLTNILGAGHLVSISILLLIFNFIYISFSIGKIEKRNKNKTDLENSLKYYNNTVSYNALEILSHHYPEFYIKDKYLNKTNKDIKITYYDLLDEEIFEKIFECKKNQINKDDQLFFELIDKMQK